MGGAGPDVVSDKNKAEGSLKRTAEIKFQGVLSKHVC